MSNVARNAPANSPPARSCIVCGKPFSGSGRALYCGPACRLRAFRLRHLEDREVLRLEATRPLRRRAGLLSHLLWGAESPSELSLGWEPLQPGLMADLDEGHYFEHLRAA